MSSEQENDTPGFAQLDEELNHIPMKAEPQGTKKLSLRGISLEIYDSIDGQKNINTLNNELMASYNLQFFESKGLLFHYLDRLKKGGWIKTSAKNEP